MMEGIHVTRAHLHALLKDAQIALVEHRIEQAGAIISALSKITAPDTHPARAPLPMFHAPSLAAEEAQPAHDLPVEPGSRGTPAVGTPAAEGAPVAPAPSPAQAAAGDSAPRARAKSSTPNTGRAGGVWTAERDDLLRSMWVTGATAAEALSAINALPAENPVASNQAIYNRVCHLRIERPPEVRAQMLMRNGKLGAEKARDLVERGEITLGAKPVVWTDERRALAKQMWEAGEHADAILEAVNRIDAPAPVQSPHAVRTQAAHQGWQRPASFLEAKRADYAERMRGRNRAAMEASPAAQSPEPALTSVAEAPAEPALEPEQSQAPAPAPTPLARPIAPGDEKADAFEYFACGKTVRDVVDEFDVSLTTAVGWHAEWKRQQQGKAA